MVRNATGTCHRRRTLPGHLAGPGRRGGTNAFSGPRPVRLRPAARATLARHTCPCYWFGRVSCCSGGRVGRLSGPLRRLGGGSSQIKRQFNTVATRVAPAALAPARRRGCTTVGQVPSDDASAPLCRTPYRVKASRESESYGDERSPTRFAAHPINRGDIIEASRAMRTCIMPLGYCGRCESIETGGRIRHVAGIGAENPGWPGERRHRGRRAERGRGRDVTGLGSSLPVSCGRSPFQDSFKSLPRNISPASVGARPRPAGRAYAKLADRPGVNGRGRIGHVAVRGRPRDAAKLFRRRARAPAGSGRSRTPMAVQRGPCAASRTPEVVPCAPGLRRPADLGDRRADAGRPCSRCSRP